MKNKKNIYYIPNKNNIYKKISKILKKNDMMIIMGAGNINSITDNLITEIKKENVKIKT